MDDPAHVCPQSRRSAFCEVKEVGQRGTTDSVQTLVLGLCTAPDELEHRTLWGTLLSLPSRVAMVTARMRAGYRPFVAGLRWWRQ